MSFRDTLRLLTFTAVQTIGLGIWLGLDHRGHGEIGLGVLFVFLFVGNILQHRAARKELGIE